jgi:hypothetical protein
MNIFCPLPFKNELSKCPTTAPLTKLTPPFYGLYDYLDKYTVQLTASFLGANS